jgi:general L-amino acid transport system permease protein
MSDIQAEVGAYDPGLHPDLPPPPASTGVLGWIKHNVVPSFEHAAITLVIAAVISAALVFAAEMSPLVAVMAAVIILAIVNAIIKAIQPDRAIMGQTLLTIFAAIVFYFLLSGLIGFTLIDAVWDAKDKKDCATSPDGACWGFITARFEQFMYGFYPHVERWRVDLWAVILTVGIAAVIFVEGPRRQRIAFGLIGLGVILFVWQLLTGDPSTRAVLWMAGLMALGLLLLLPPARMRSVVGLFMLLAYPLLSFWLLSGSFGFIVPFLLPVAGLMIASLGSDRVQSAGLLMLGLFVLILLLGIFSAILGLLSSIGIPLLGSVADAINFVLSPYWGDWGLDGFSFTYVETDKWGGLMLTLVVAISGIAASLPLGVLLALGRRSKMPVVRTMCVMFIEFWRGVPLITVLFMASVMFPLFLPEGVTFNQLLRALIGVALFSAAYMAEVVRGGLQALPTGQFEAADALGLNYFKSMRLIVLPQALKIVIPGIVNTFIGLFKDTTLVAIIGLIDFLAQVDTGMRDSSWLAPNVPYTGYLTVAAVFWVFCYSMSLYSRSVERRLETGHKR